MTRRSFIYCGLARVPQQLGNFLALRLVARFLGLTDDCNSSVPICTDAEVLLRLRLCTRWRSRESCLHPSGVILPKKITARCVPITTRYVCYRSHCWSVLLNVGYLRTGEIVGSRTVLGSRRQRFFYQTVVFFGRRQEHPMYGILGHHHHHHHHHIILKNTFYAYL